MDDLVGAVVIFVGVLVVIWILVQVFSSGMFIKDQDDEWRG